MISRCKTILLTMFLLTSPYLLTAYGVKEGKKNIEPVGLQCEYLHNPSGLDIPHPRLSWKMGTTVAVRGQRQTAYQVLVASSRELLDKEQGDLWDSGQVHSDESVHIVYDGKTLITGQKCFWLMNRATGHHGVNRLIGRWDCLPMIGVPIG